MMELFDFIDRTPTAFHAVRNSANILSENGYTELYECENWNIERGGKYFVTRNGSSIIAFSVPECDYTGFMACASHTDSPCFKMKSSPELSGNGIVRFNVEGYGGMIRESWFDRPLSVAGRVAVIGDGAIEYRLVDIDRDLMVIPSLAVHMGSPRNDDRVNIQNEMLPVFGTDGGEADILSLAAENMGADKDSIAGFEPFVYNRMKATVFGAENEFF